MSEELSVMERWILSSVPRLGNAVQFSNLGLLIVDEEQRFGVRHKEWFKELKADVHVLTLSATPPIPRTLQLALTGMCENYRSLRRHRLTV